jgi:hypothetical protein
VRCSCLCSCRYRCCYALLLPWSYALLLRETVMRRSWVVLVPIAAVVRCSCLGLMSCCCERLLCGALGLVLSLITLLLLIILTTRDEVLVCTLLQVCRHTQAARVRHADELLLHMYFTTGFLLDMPQLYYPFLFCVFTSLANSRPHTLVA